MNHNKTHWPLVFLLWFAGLGASMQFAKISVTFHELEKHYAANASQISLVLSLTGLVGLLLAASSSLLIQRWGYKLVLLSALLLGALLSFIEATLPTLSTLLILRIIEGASHLAIVVTAPTLMAAASAPQHRSLVMSLWGTFFGVSFSIASAFAPALTDAYGVAGLYITHGVWMLLIFTALLTLLDKHLIASTPTNISLRSIIERHKHIYGHFTTVLPSLVFICSTSMYVALLTLLPLMGPTPEWVMVALPLISIAGAFCSGLINQYWLSPPAMVKLAFVWVLFALVALGFAHMHGWNLDLFKIALFLGLGLQQGAIYGMIPYLAKESHQQAQSIAAIAQMGNLGSTIGPPLFASAWASFAVSGLIGLGILITGAGLLLMLYAFWNLQKH